MNYDFFFNDNDPKADFELVCWLIEKGELNFLFEEMAPELFQTKIMNKRVRTENLGHEDSWKTNRGLLYLNPLTSHQGTRFRERFRVPLPFLKSFVEV